MGRTGRNVRLDGRNGPGELRVFMRVVFEAGMMIDGLIMG